MANVNMSTVLKAKLFSDLLKYLDDVSTSLMIQRDDMLESDENELNMESVEEINKLLDKNEEFECDIKTLLITEVDRMHEEVMEIQIP
ncbi:hypothetical protein COE98_20760 [Bacillus wiedmannii]|uniref:hypothetical protein n=1 Tax=Bacillus wiedmannii TaxID=1890302 RepID=UPI000BFCCC80|nr:hypothetical protein [Bacillus wiedmannii]MCU5706100.1 hypothetical protein [Bacillus wiedmannii]PHB88136.1 hypothetical protein COE98_20760 [Bacillus wiedmannii]